MNRFLCETFPALSFAAMISFTLNFFCGFASSALVSRVRQTFVRPRDFEPAMHGFRCT